MSILKFNDGINLNTDGEWRKEEKADGWYVLGHGRSIPVADEISANFWVDKGQREYKEGKYADRQD